MANEVSAGADAADEADVGGPRADALVRTVKHPIFWVDDLDDAAQWLSRLFGRPSRTTVDLMGDLPQREGYAVDYGIFHLVQDTFIESIDPDRLILGGRKSFPLRGIPPVAVPSLGHLGWYVDDAATVFARLQQGGWQCLDQVGEITTQISFGGKVGYPSFYVLRDEAGLAYQFMECAPGEANAARTGDARLIPGWRLSPPPADDELGVLLCARHTVTTRHPECVLSLWVDALGGRVVHQGANELLGATSTYVALGDGIFECAVPTGDTAHVSGPANPEPYDTYHSMTFLVRDLDRAQAHLSGLGMRIARRDDTTLIVDPATGLGVPWGFTTTLVPGDPRADWRLLNRGNDDDAD